MFSSFSALINYNYYKNKFDEIKTICQYNKNLPIKIYHFGTVEFVNIDNLYDINDNLINYHYLPYSNLDNFLNMLESTFKKLFEECINFNILIFFNFSCHEESINIIQFINSYLLNE